LFCVTTRGALGKAAFVCRLNIIHINYPLRNKPIRQALTEEGIQAAYAGYVEIKASKAEKYYFDADNLINLEVQLVSVKNLTWLLRC
jgi:hypothetical protein